MGCKQFFVRSFTMFRCSKHLTPSPYRIHATHNGNIRLFHSNSCPSSCAYLMRRGLLSALSFNAIVYISQLKGFLCVHFDNQMQPKRPHCTIPFPPICVVIVDCRRARYAIKKTEWVLMEIEINAINSIQTTKDRDSFEPTIQIAWMQMRCNQIY